MLNESEYGKRISLAFPMQFNFELFSAFAKNAYDNVLKRNGNKQFFPFWDTLIVFAYYFFVYEKKTGKIHPNIRLPQIEKIIGMMPFADSSIGTPIKSADYLLLIDKHFQTSYRNCDYHIWHFFSGKIRHLRYLEVLRGEPD